MRRGGAAPRPARARTRGLWAGGAARALHGRALLVGDAAGLIDPVSGDGMYEAFVSARLAAECALELLDGRAHTLDAYAARLRVALDPLTLVSWGVKRFAERWPR